MTPRITASVNFITPTPRSGSASGTFAFTGSADGEADHNGSATGTFSWTGAASGSTFTPTAPPAMPVGNLPGDTKSPLGWTQTLAEDFVVDEIPPPVQEKHAEHLGRSMGHLQMQIVNNAGEAPQQGALFGEASQRASQC